LRRNIFERNIFERNISGTSEQNAEGYLGPIVVDDLYSDGVARIIGMTPENRFVVWSLGTKLGKADWPTFAHDMGRTNCFNC
jgi:hypothetical protein